MIACDIGIVLASSYSYSLELGIMVCISLILIGNLALYIVQIVWAYHPEITEWLGIGKREVDKVEIVEEKKFEEEHDKQIEKVEMDAFFERVLNKNKINKQYRRERRMRERD